MRRPTSGRRITLAGELRKRAHLRARVDPTPFEGDLGSPGPEWKAVMRKLMEASVGWYSRKRKTDPIPRLLPIAGERRDRLVRWYARELTRLARLGR